MRLPLPQFSPSDRHPHHIAEVIETATTEFLSQCLEPEDLNFPSMPAFGSWVKAFDEESNNTIYGVVYHACTVPIDSVHRARALGMSLEELREQQPQIFAMLKTEFRTAIVGFTQLDPFAQGNGHRRGADPTSSDRIRQHLPPRPPQIHQAVYQCDAEEIIAFTEELDFLRILLQIPSAPVDSLTAAAIREAYRIRQFDRDWLVRAGRNLGILLKDDYDRLRSILNQIHP